MPLNKTPILAAAALALTAACAGPSKAVSPNSYSPKCTEAQANTRQHLVELVSYSMSTGLPACHIVCSDEGQAAGLTLEDFQKDLAAVDSLCDTPQAASVKQAFCNVLAGCACAKDTCKDTPADSH